MNYRHHFHAGNFADLAKHAALLAILRRLTAQGPPLTVVDTHAGAGIYDLHGDMARKSGEAEAGIVRLMADPAAPSVFAELKAAVARANPAKDLRFYPGSPLLTAWSIRPVDRLFAFEMRPEDARGLGEALAPFDNARAIAGDGFEAVAARVPARGQALVVIDPPFERADDYQRVVTGLSAILTANPAAVVLVWTPLKDLETFDWLLRAFEEAGAPPTVVAEIRLRPLSDPLRLNGCALTVTNAPAGLEADLRRVCDWVVKTLGEPGGEARVWML